MRIQIPLLAALLSGLAPAGAQAQDAGTLYTRALAATCANCHGTDGRASEGSAVPSLAGMPREEMLRHMAAFRDGSRQATVMHQLAKGLTQEQINTMATYFAAVKR